jgi:hypothetical protein
VPRNDLISWEGPMARKSSNKPKPPPSEAASAEPTPAPEPEVAPAVEPETPPAPEAVPESAPEAEAPPPSAAAQQDSATFARCAGCANAKEIDRSAGTLVCAQYNMLVNAEADEIPDDCVEYKPAAASPAAPPPETPAPEAPAPETPQ